MHILHIVNGYCGSSVYKNLFTSLDILGIIQTIYVPLNSNNQKISDDHTINFSVKGSSIIYSTDRKWYHRFLYNAKISVIIKKLMHSIDINRIDLIHAHTLCLEGAVAYKIHQKHDIPYIAAVRNTDVNTYYKKLFWKRGFFEQILLKAQNIIFISPAYKKLFFEKKISNSIYDLIDEKSLIVPNGISNFFLEKRVLSKEIHKPIQIIYSGVFQKGKNIHRVIKAIDKLIIKGYDFQFTAIGIGLYNRNNNVKYVRKIKKISRSRQWIKLENSVKQSELCNVLNENDIFVMPSITETFGLVYVEALSQGLPILYSKGQGFDGFYEEGKVGYGVNSLDINDIADKIEQIVENYQKIKNKIFEVSLEQFNWSIIAEKYIRIYNNTF